MDWSDEKTHRRRQLTKTAWAAAKNFLSIIGLWALLTFAINQAGGPCLMWSGSVACAKINVDRDDVTRVVINSQQLGIRVAKLEKAMLKAAEDLEMSRYKSAVALDLRKALGPDQN
jgi:hypothetical protein